MLLFEKGDFLFSFDLKSGYHHIDIAEAHFKYLGVSWEGSLTFSLSFPLACALPVTSLQKWSVPLFAIGGVRASEF